MPQPRVAARTFRDLLVWQKAHQFVLGVYSFTAAFPKQETYALSLQMRRAAVSIPANIAEGFRRRGKADRARYMNIAEGSIEECRYYFGKLDSPALGWSFTVNHAHIRPNRIDAFMAGLDMRRCGEVRLADCRGTHEEHLRPGEGTIDFPAMFAAIEASGYRGHYMQAFGSLDDMLKGRETLAALATEAARK